MPNVKNNSLAGFDKPFAKQLRRLIDETGTSQAELAKEVGVTRQAISSYSLGTTIPDIEKFEKIADYFGVSFEFLLGRSENKKSENTEIGKITGLSDEAITQLSKKKSNSSFTSVLNYLITEEKLLRYLDNYLLGFVFSEVQKTDYKFLPLKRYPSPHHTKIMFAELIEHLPIVRSEIETDFVKNQDLINMLILEYLSKNADIARCKTYIHDEDFEPYDYEPDPEIETEDLYEEYMKQQKEEQFFQDNFIRLQDAIMYLFSYLANKNKEGAQNGDNSKA